MDILELATPLYRVRRWLMFVGIMLFMQAFFLAISVVGLIVAWLPVWLAVLCFQIARSVNDAYSNQDELALTRANSKIGTAIFLLGVVLLISLILGILAFLLGGFDGIPGEALQY